MSLGTCLPDLERKGALDAGRSKEAQKLYDELYRFYRRSHDDDAAASLASQKTVERLEAAAAHKKRNTIRQAKAQGKILMAAKRDGMPLDPEVARQQFDQVDARAKTIKGRVHAMMEGLLYKHRPKLSGEIRAKADLEQLRAEIMRPGSTGNANAAELAEAVTGGLEYLRGRFNEAGGAIGKLEGWVPQTHSSRKIRDAGFKAWRDFITPRLDRARMIDRQTGEPFTDEAFEGFLRDVFETLRTDGWNKATPGATGGKMLANQRADHRILHFADPEGAAQYEAEFGGGHLYDALIGHIESMSRDIALLEELGPNPPATVRWLKDSLVKSAEIDASPGSKAIAEAKRGASDVALLYDEITGANRVPYREDLALKFGTLRAMQTAAKLGAATLSAVTDIPVAWRTLKFNGIAPTHYLGQMLKQLNPASAADRRFAVRMGLIADEWAAITATTARYIAEDFGSERARRLASGVLRLSGLQAWTQGGRWAHGMAMLGELTDLRETAFAKLDKELLRAFGRHNINEADWDAIRTSPLAKHRGAEFIDANKIENQAAGDKLLELINTERDFAIPMPDLRTREAFNRFSGMRGTWGGELKRTMLLFKGFSFALVRMQGKRAASLGAVSGGLYAANLFIGMTLFGALAVQMKEIAKGKDPRPMFDDNGLPDPEFWGAAALQGGGLGIFGDFLGSSENRFGGGFASTLAGPGVQTAQNAADLTIGNAMKAARGDKTDVGRDTVKFIKQETPGSSLWYLRLAFERVVADWLQEEIDPNYRQSWRAIERKARERDQEFWWEPGETSPDRAPDVDNAWGGTDQ